MGKRVRVCARVPVCVCEGVEGARSIMGCNVASWSTTKTRRCPFSNHRSCVKVSRTLLVRLLMYEWVNVACYKMPSVSWYTRVAIHHCCCACGGQSHGDHGVRICSEPVISLHFWFHPSQGQILEMAAVTSKKKCFATAAVTSVSHFTEQKRKILMSEFRWTHV